MIPQTDDTDHHAHARKIFIELQIDLLARKARRMGGCLVDITAEHILASRSKSCQTKVNMCRQVKGTSTQAPQLT